MKNLVARDLWFTGVFDLRQMAWQFPSQIAVST